MSEFIQFGSKYIARRDVLRVDLYESGQVHVLTGDRKWLFLEDMDIESIRNQLNPPQSRHPQWAYFTSQETK